MICSHCSAHLIEFDGFYFHPVALENLHPVFDPFSCPFETLPLRDPPDDAEAVSLPEGASPVPPKLAEPGDVERKILAYWNLYLIDYPNAREPYAVTRARMYILANGG